MVCKFKPELKAMARRAYNDSADACNRSKSAIMVVQKMVVGVLNSNL
jgi:hypothetical protein